VTTGPAPRPLEEQVDAIGSLQEPVRRALYLYVASRPGDVGRDEAAAAVGVRRTLAAFHLDKLVEAGLLEATFRRLSGRAGPGAGRPAKLYHRSSAEHTVSLPPRHYDLAAELLAEAVDEAGDGPAAESVGRVARRFGVGLGREVQATLGRRAGRERRLAALAEVLERHGYQPRRDGQTVRLGNCPFHALSESHRRLVCGMNLSLLEGVVEGMGADDLETRSDPPGPGECCVLVAARPRKA
jgi:predicted ArsR family transcriptional regulator